MDVLTFLNVDLQKKLMKINQDVMKCYGMLLTSYNSIKMQRKGS